MRRQRREDPGSGRLTARRTIDIGMYIIHEDDEGRLFAEALLRKARKGVHVRLLYDWMEGFGKTSRSFWSDRQP